MGVMNVERRIIPARAGFTSAGWTVMPRSADHPRSRGVYDSVGQRLALAPGSSPLARGLRPEGFRQSIRGMDHPRSRGVYINAKTILATQ